MMTSNEKFRDFLATVHKRTVEGTLRWEETPDPNAFKALFQSGTLVLVVEKIYGVKESEDAHVVRAELLTPGGRVANQLFATSTKGGELYEELLALFQLARTNARRGDQLLEELMREVG